MDDKKPIPASLGVPYTRWEMPDLTGVKRRIAQRLTELEAEQAAHLDEDTQEAESMLSSEALETLREEARAEGYQQGYEEGFQSGSEKGWTTGYQEGQREGEAAGFEAGRKKGLTQARHEVDHQLAQLQALLDQLLSPLQALDHEVEQALLLLVDQICRSVIRREISLNRDYLQGVLQEAIEALPPGQQRIRLYAHPDDLTLLHSYAETLLDDYRLLPDENISPGGLRIETHQSLVDATLERRYRKVLDGLLQQSYAQQRPQQEVVAQAVLENPGFEPEPLAEPVNPSSTSPVPAAESGLDEVAASASESPVTVPEAEPEPQPAEVVTPQFRAAETPADEPTKPRRNIPTNLPPLQSSKPAAEEVQETQLDPEPASESEAAADPEPEAAPEPPQPDMPSPETGSEPTAEEPAPKVPADAGVERMDETEAADETLASEAAENWAADAVHEDHYGDSEDWLEEAQDEAADVLPRMEDENGTEPPNDESKPS